MMDIKEMCKVRDLIDRNTLIDLLDGMAAEAEGLKVDDDDSYYNGLVDAMQCAEGVPPVIDVKPVQHAHWEDCDENGDEYGRGWYACGNCKHLVSMAFVLRPFKYCPNCGARMDIGEEEFEARMW